MAPSLQSTKHQTPEAAPEGGGYSQVGPIRAAALGMVCLPDPSLVRCFGHAQLGKDHGQNQGVVWERMRSVVGSE